MNKKTILIDIGGTSIRGGLYNSENDNIENIISIDTPEYTLNNVLDKIDEIVTQFQTYDINFIGISLNGQVNNGYVYFSRILGGKVELNLSELLEKKYGIVTKIENDVNCMALGYSNLSKNETDYMVLLNIGTGIRTSYVYQGKLLKGHKGFFGEVRDYLYVKELEKEVNINDLVCGRGITNIYNILYSENKSAKQIYKNYIIGDKKSLKVINIFIKYLLQMMTRISYSFNPEEIVIDGSLKKIVEDNYESIIKEYEKQCEPHFIAKIKISNFENTNLYGALIL